MKKAFALAGAALAAMMTMQASAQTLQTTGDGYIDFNAAPFYYTVYGNNDGNAGLTTFSAVAAADFTQSFGWKYTTNDIGGAAFDPAGYFIGESFFQLSPLSSSSPFSTSGIITISVAAGQTFGAFVNSTDGILGRGSISFGDPSAVAAVPEPATWGLMILGFGAVGGAMRRRQSVKANVRFA